MRFKVIPEDFASAHNRWASRTRCHLVPLYPRACARQQDFAVEERTHLSLAPKGSFAVYRVRKRGVTTLRVQVQSKFYQRRDWP